MDNQQEQVLDSSREQKQYLPTGQFESLVIQKRS